MDDRPMTSHELAKRLLEMPDLPLVIRTRPEGGIPGDEEWTSTVVTDQSISLNMHSRSGTAWGDLPRAVRIDLELVDNA